MGHVPRSVSQNPFGTVLPSDLVRAAIDRVDDIVMVTEAGVVGETGLRILFVNPAFERITGYPVDEVLGRSPSFLRGPDTSADEVHRMEMALEARSPMRTEILNYKKDGTPIWLEIEGSSMRSPSTDAEFFVFIQRDVTERKKAEEALRENERSMASLFSNLPGMAYRCRNDGAWTMEFASDGCRDLTGYESSELVGNRLVSFEDIIHPEDRKTVREIDASTREPRGAFELSYRIKARDGSIKWVMERGLGVRGPNGAIRYFEGFITDITERKLLEGQVVQSQRLESIGTLAGGIAHDLNNVLAPIMMAGDLLLDRVQEKDSTQLLSVISDNARRGAELVRQILLFARGMEGPRVEVKPEALFAGVRKFVESTFPKTIQASFEIAPGTGSISGDPAQLNQLLLNLVVNAKDAIREQGRVAISARSASVSPSAPRPHPDAVPGDFIRIDIMDTGSGIPDALKGQIFDPFFTTKSVGRGSGLGLSTAHAIVKAHCGFITFVSTVGIGTTFSVYLPTTEAGLSKPIREPARQSGGAPLRGEGNHILVVDDEESVRLIMRSSLENYGFRVSTAASGTEAVELASSSPARLDLAIVDMQMPGLDGSKTISALRRAFPHLPIMAASGFGSTQDREEVAANGIRHFLDKPFSVETLIRTVHDAMIKTGA
jgi:PAS domain S-box-containing protein